MDGLPPGADARVGMRCPRRPAHLVRSGSHSMVRCPARVAEPIRRAGKKLSLRRHPDAVCALTLLPSSSFGRRRRRIAGEGAVVRRQRCGADRHLRRAHPRIGEKRVRLLSPRVETAREVRAEGASERCSRAGSRSS
jgi:hypothetical protein